MACNVTLTFTNRYTPLVLQTLATAKKQDPDNAFYQRPVAVLAEKPKAEMDAVLKGLDLVVRGALVRIR